MVNIMLYDQHNLENKVIIWQRGANYPKSFLIMDQCIGQEEMLILQWDLYAIHYSDEFYKVDSDYPDLFILKEKFK